MKLMFETPVLRRQRKGDKMFEVTLAIYQVQGQPGLHETLYIFKEKNGGWRAGSSVKI